MAVTQMWSSLKLADFRRLWLCSALANSGRWAFTVAIGWSIQTLTHSSLWVGLGMFSTMIPSVLVGPFVGMMADRWNRRTIYTASLWVSMMAAVALLVTHLMGIHLLWIIIACSLGLGMTFSAQMTSTSAMIPSLVGKEFVYNASALQGTVNQGAEFFGSAMATPLLAAYGVSAVYGLCVLLYGAAAVWSMRIQLHSQPSRNPADVSAKRTVIRPILDGLSYLRHHALLGLIIILVGLHCSLTMAFNGILPEFCSQNLANANSSVYGSLMTVVGLGAMVGTFLTAGIRNKRYLGYLYAGAGLGSGAFLAILSGTHSVMWAIVMALGVGSSQAIFMAGSQAFMLERTEDAFRGRVSSVYSLLAAGLMAIANFVYGSIGTISGAAWLMATTGCLFVLLFAVIVGTSARMRGTLMHGQVDPVSIAAPPSA